MKTNVPLLCLGAALLFLDGIASGQTPTTLATFSDFNGANPQSGLVLSGTTLYGTTYYGGSSNLGTVFGVDITNGNISTLYSFQGASYSMTTSNYVTTDGGNPAGTLVLSGGTLYGTTYDGGATDSGTVFAVNTNNGSEVVLHSFTGGNGGFGPEAGLVLSEGTLYGTTTLGGIWGQGAVFRVNIDGSGFTNIYNFVGTADGANPEAALVLSGNTLYGTASAGGTNGSGTVFKVNTDGSGFATLYAFTGGNDGGAPEAGLLLNGATLYGTASGGGTDGFGTVFRVNTNGSGFASYLFNFSNGASSQAALTLVGSALYGTAPNGGAPGWGTIFKINTDGSSFTNVYAFTDDGDGASPEAELLAVGGTLYGTTEANTPYGYGTVFALTLPTGSATLNISQTNGGVVLSWSNAAFALESSTNVASGYTNITSTSPYTTSAGDRQRFYRLVSSQ